MISYQVPAFPEKKIKDIRVFERIQWENEIDLPNIWNFKLSAQVIITRLQTFTYENCDRPKN